MTMPPRVARLILPGSLALNAFLLAAGAALVLHGPPMPPNPARLAASMERGLSAADAAVLRDAFASRTAALDAGYHAMRTVPDRVAAVFAAPSFDAEAMRRVFAEGRSAQSGMDTAITAALLDAAMHMSPEGRRQLAAWRPWH